MEHRLCSIQAYARRTPWWPVTAAALAWSSSETVTDAQLGRTAAKGIPKTHLVSPSEDVDTCKSCHKVHASSMLVTGAFAIIPLGICLSRVQQSRTSAHVWTCPLQLAQPTSRICPNCIWPAVARPPLQQVCNLRSSLSSRHLRLPACKRHACRSHNFVVTLQQPCHAVLFNKAVLPYSRSQPGKLCAMHPSTTRGVHCCSLENVHWKISLRLFLRYFAPVELLWNSW